MNAKGRRPRCEENERAVLPRDSGHRAKTPRESVHVVEVTEGVDGRRDQTDRMIQGELREVIASSPGQPFPGPDSTLLQRHYLEVAEGEGRVLTRQIHRTAREQVSVQPADENSSIDEETKRLALRFDAERVPSAA